MSRGISVGMTAEVAANELRPVLLAFFDFAGGAVRMWNGYRNLVWDGNTYTASGTFGSISPVEESLDLSAKGASIQLSGIPTDVLALALSDDYQGRPAKIWLGAIDSSGALVTSPVLIFGGRMDTMSLADAGETGTLTLTCESHLIDLNRSRERRYTDQDQRIDYPTDRGFEFVAGLQDKNIVWGAASAVTTGGGGAAGDGGFSEMP